MNICFNRLEPVELSASGSSSRALRPGGASLAPIPAWAAGFPPLWGLPGSTRSYIRSASVFSLRSTPGDHDHAVAGVRHFAHLEECGEVAGSIEIPVEAQPARLAVEDSLG